MKKKRFFMLFALVSIVSATMAQENEGLQLPNDTVVLTLDNCLEIALSDNLTVQIAGKEIEKQTYTKNSTYSSLYPQISATGSYQYTIKKQGMYMDINGETRRIEVGRDMTTSGTLAATMPIVNAQLWKTLQISEVEVDLAVEKSRSSKLDMVATVTECYYTVLLAYKSYQIMETALNNAKTNYENVKHRYELGLSSEYDMIRAGVEVSSYEPQVFSALNAIELAKWQLKAVVGMELDTPINCKGDLEDYTDMMHSQINDTINLENNTSIKQLNLQMDEMDKTVQMYKRAYIPTLSGSFNYQLYAMENNLDFDKYFWAPYSLAGLSLNIPIFSGLKKMNDIRTAKVQKTQLELQKENIRRELYVSAKQILSSMETYVKQYDAADAAVDQAIRGYNISTKRYDTGKGTILEVNDSRLAAIDAKVTRDKAIYNYLVAKASFEKIMGTAIE